MREFFRFPHTPHLVWLGAGLPRDDKVLPPYEVDDLLRGDVLVEEKLDGANLGISLAPDGGFCVQNRGQYLHEPYSGQFSRFPSWLAQYGDGLRAVLKPHMIIFGEWCAARHSLKYAALPNLFLLFDVYDLPNDRFWCSPRRNSLADEAGLITVPQLMHAKTTVSDLTKLATTTASRCGSEVLEGLIVRRESSEWCEVRAKVVRSDFTQSIDTHWRNKALEWNRVKPRTA